VFDSILFERHGVPSVPIITEPFVPSARAIAARHGRPEFPHVAVPHPITSLDDDQLRQRAALAAPLVADILLGRAG
jgi:hypothetical protein